MNLISLKLYKRVMASYLYLEKFNGIALVTRVAMETPKNRCCTNMDDGPCGHRNMQKELW